MKDAKTYLGVAEAARYLTVSRSFLDKARVAGSGPAFCKLGRRVVYDVADLDAWAKAGKRASTSEAAA